MLKARLGALFAFVLCVSILVFEWVLRTRTGLLHPMALIVCGAGTTLSFTGLVAPAITQLTAQGQLSPLAHKIGLLGFALGGALWFALR